MLGKIVLIFEIVIIILYGIFIRINPSAQLTTSNLSPSLLFVVAYFYLYSKHRSLDWTILTNYLFILSLTFQINTLYYLFWYLAFLGEFTSTSSLSDQILIIGMQASFSVIITISLFINRLNQLQVFIICMVEVFGFALNWGICRWGVQAITSGGSSTIWLYGLIVGILIKKLKFSDVPDPKSNRYFTKLLQMVSLVFLVCLWPNFNQITTQLDLGVINLSSGNLLKQEAYIQTWLCLFSCIATTLSLRILGEKMLLQKIVNSIINTGILFASSACMIIDPFASLLMGMIGPILCFLYDKFGERLKSTGYPFDMLIMAFLGGVFSAIYAGGRNGRQPSLSSDPLRQGGLQFSMTLISIIFGVVFGLIAGLIIRCTGSQTLQQTDMSVWQIETECMPLYHDDPKLQKLYRAEDQQRLQIQQQHFSIKQRYLTSQVHQVKEGEQHRKQIKKEINNISRISNSSSKNNEWP